MAETVIEIDGEDFRINGEPTYKGRRHDGRRIEGLLLNSRMVQAIFDDECEETRPCWAYPDTGEWDPDRNVAEFCAALPEYRRHGLLAVTVGLQGGGSIYSEPVYGNYVNSAFRPDGSIKQGYLERLLRVIEAADANGMVVIVNYFYWRQERFEGDAAILRAVESATQWLLETGRRNLLIDVRNEITEGDGLLASLGIGRLVDVVKAATLDGRRIPVGVSTHPVDALPPGDWPDKVDFFLPHGNDSQPEEWRTQLQALRQLDAFRKNPRPICCNEDSIDLRNMEAALDEHCSWGYYDQGYGCGQRQVKCDWTEHEREEDYGALSGFQTVPVNWTINTPHKRAFFSRLKEVTQ